MDILDISLIDGKLRQQKTTITDFTKAVDIPRASWFNIKSGRGSLTCSQVFRIAAFFKVPVSEILTEEAKAQLGPANTRVNIQHLLNEIEHLKNENALKDQIIRLLEAKKG